MPFGGTVSYPETDNLLMVADDPGGVGSVSITGSATDDGSDVSVSQISGDDGSGAFTLMITENRLASYAKDGITVTFSYPDESSVTLEVTDSSGPLIPATASLISTSMLPWV